MKNMKLLYTNNPTAAAMSTEIGCIRTTAVIDS